MKRIICVISIAFITNLVSAQIPSLSVQDESGSIHNLPDLMQDRSKNYLIAFWATWCTPCIRELDAWKNYAADWENNYGVEILGINVDRESARGAARSMWEIKGWFGALLYADYDLAKSAFDFSFIPKAILFDNSGKVIFDHSGYRTGDEIKLDSIIKSNAPINGPVMKYISPDTIDYGTISEGSDPERYWYFMNRGNQPLLIKSVKGSSGACVPTYPKDPIPPGDTAAITVRYDTKRLGVFLKSITIETNEDDGTGNNKEHKIWKRGNVLKETSSVIEKALEAVSVYPTLTDSDLEIEFKGNVPPNCKYVVYDRFGKMFLSGTIQNQRTTLFTGSLISGSFFVEIKSGRKKIVKQFVKN